MFIVVLKVWTYVIKVDTFVTTAHKSELKNHP